MSSHNKVRKYQAKRGKKARGLVGDVVLGKGGKPIDDEADSDVADFADSPATSYDVKESTDLRAEVEEKFLSLIKEDLSSEDPTDLMTALDVNTLDHVVLVELVAVILRYGLEVTTKRELVSQLLATLSVQEYITEVQVEKGFSLVFGQFPDLELDNPNASETIGKFLARAIADDCLRPAWVNNHPGLHDINFQGELATNALQVAHALISVKGEFSRLDSIWGLVGAYQPVRSLIKQIKALIDEYIDTQNIEEALHCLHDLAVPHFHHEFVYEVILSALEKWSEEQGQRFSSLLSVSFAEGFVPVQEMILGFRRISNDLPDIVLDVPKAYEIFPLIVDLAVKQGYISALLQAELIAPKPSQQSA